MSWANQWGRVILLLAIITFIAHFWHYQSLGLYEDDYFLIGQPMSMNLDDAWEFIKWHIINFHLTEGRPLLYIIEFSVGFLGNLIQNLKALYLIDYLAILINNILVYVLLKHLWNQPFFIITGTLAFTLFPADTNHAYLGHINLYSSVTFLLLALFCYFYHKKILSYLLIFASLFCYETVFTAFLAAPLLKKSWNRKILKEILGHTIILVAMLGAVFILRKVTGEDRINQLDFLTLIFTPLRQIIIGPIVSLSMFFYRPAQTLLNLKGELLVFIPLSFIGLVGFLSSYLMFVDNLTGSIAVGVFQIL